MGKCIKIDLTDSIKRKLILKGVSGRERTRILREIGKVADKKASQLIPLRECE